MPRNSDEAVEWPDERTEVPLSELLYRLELTLDSSTEPFDSLEEDNAESN